MVKSDYNLGHPGNINRFAAADVKYLVICFLFYHRCQTSLNNITDMDKITGLLSVFIDYRGLTVLNPAHKDGCHTVVRIGKALTRTVDIKKTQGHCGYAVSAAYIKNHFFLNFLGDGIYGIGSLSSIFICGK